jgi:hypothetical protein
MQFSRRVWGWGEIAGSSARVEILRDQPGIAPQGRCKPWPALGQRTTWVDRDLYNRGVVGFYCWHAGT